MNYIHCKHFQSVFHNQSCKAGVAYSRLPGPFDKWPCCCKAGTEQVPSPLCELVVYPTKEEQEAEEREIQALFARTDTARKAIVDHLGGPWKPGADGAHGAIECPICKSGSLRFSRAACNGHIHAACTTEDCVSWME